MMGMLRLLGLVAFVAVAALAVSGGSVGPAQGAVPGANGKIAFITANSPGTSGSPYNIWTMDENGLNQKQLTQFSGNGTGVQERFDWSPDGTKIVFDAIPVAGAARDIFVIDADGQNQKPLTNTPSVQEEGPAWSPDGKQIAYRGANDIATMDSTGANQTELNTGVTASQYPTWSPDGTQIAFVGGDDGGSGGALYKTDLLGSVNKLVGPLTNVGWPDWSPDGSKILFTTRSAPAPLEVDVVDTNGQGQSTLISGAHSASWSPDGKKIVYSGSSLNTAAISGGDVSIEGGGLRTNDIFVTDASGGPGTNIFSGVGLYPDWQPTAVIVFLHGFLGSRILCGNAELWPNIPPGPNFDSMRLLPDGATNAPATCGAMVGDILDTVLGSSIYKSAIDYLNTIAPGNAYFFAWDWRSSPQNALGDLDTFIDNIRNSHPGQKVVIMAHSYGGLLARLYIDDPTRAAKVSRVLTVGTPAWGSPKALFPLYAGVETPDISTLDPFLDNDGLHEFAKNLFGAYYLYPTANYGTWLYNDSTAATQADVESLVSQLGGTVSLLQQAEVTHSSTLDSFPSNGDFEAIVGTGIPTISGVHILDDGYLGIDYDNGDGTVPARSAARGPTGGANPNAAHTHYACGVGHVPLPGDQQVTDAVTSYLLSGDKIKGLTTVCPANGVQFRLFQLPNFVPTAVDAAGTDALTVQDAQEHGLVDYLDLTKEKFVITGQTFPDIVLPEGKYLEVTPLMDGAKGEPQLFGPLSGAVTISATDGVVKVSQDGQELAPEGDSNCDHAVTAADALADFAYAAGVSTPGCLANAEANCDGSVTVVDAIDDLRTVADVPVLRDANCST
ncbi:MAG: alpha/beta hydrolase [Chloroflexota bacterium]